MKRLAATLLLWLVLLVPALAEDSPYVRVVRDPRGNARSLQTSITSMVDPQGRQLDLVATTHLAERGYYERLNRQFQAYDAVLYELISDTPQQDLPAHLSETASDPLSATQQGLANLLGLDFQLRHIDYTAPNFVHADLTFSEFQQAMVAGNESVATILARLINSSVNEVEDPKELEALSQINLLKILTVGPSAADQRLLRQALASTFAQMDRTISALGGTALLDGRNQRALEVLDRRLEAGDRKLALFYGAAHMPDLESRLHQAGWKTGRRSWLTAWNL
ncbi:MAG: hypothetical protein AB7S38_36240 [Vulcanimicrobiota bacterium]